MMHTRFVIQMTLSTRPNLEYFYYGQNRKGYPVFKLTKVGAKRYYFLEEADRDVRILSAVEKADTFKVITVRCRT